MIELTPADRPGAVMADAGVMRLQTIRAVADRVDVHRAVGRLVITAHLTF